MHNRGPAKRDQMDTLIGWRTLTLLVTLDCWHSSTHAREKRRSWPSLWMIQHQSCLLTRPFPAQRPLPVWAVLSDRMVVPTRTFRADRAKPGTPLGVWMQSGDHHSTASGLSWSSTRAAYCRPFCMDQSAGRWPSMTLPSCCPFTWQGLGKSNASFCQEPSPSMTSLHSASKKICKPSSPESHGAGLGMCCAKMPIHYQSCNPLDSRGKAEAWSTKDNLVRNCGSGNEENKPQLGHHPEAGQWQTGVEELHCCPIYQLAWWVVMKWNFVDLPRAVRKMQVVTYVYVQRYYLLLSTKTTKYRQAPKSVVLVEYSHDWEVSVQ